MKKFSKILTVLLLLAMIIGCFAACDLGANEPEESSAEESKAAETTANNNDGETTEVVTEAATEPEFVDYASQAKFDPNSGRLYAEVTVHQFVDGDTTHFNVDKSIVPTGTLKARYLAINTPESTGVIEPWGKKASNYTKETLSKATSIIIESDSNKWDIDSTGERRLVWVWYKTAEMTEYRNINLEILQQGLAFGSNVADNAYADIALSALNQAKAFKLHVFSNEKDPDFYYGGVISVSLRELKLNYAAYEGKLVRFEGTVVKGNGSTFYLEDYDAETGMYFGMQVYAGFNVLGAVIEALAIGNRVVMVGTLQYYAAGDTYQVSNIQYGVDLMDPDGALSKDGVHVVEGGHSASYNEISASDIVNGKLTLNVPSVDEEGNEIMTPTVFDYGALAHYSTATVKNLTIVSTYTTQNGGSNDGAISITCVAEDGTQIVIRTEVLRDADKNLIGEESFSIGSNITVKGIIDSYDGQYQIKVFSFSDVTFN